MLAAAATSIDPADPLSGLTVGEFPDPEPAEGWVRVAVRAASLNHHDLWSLKGVGLPADRLPMILGCDAAGVLADGTEVIVKPRGSSGTADPLDQRSSVGWKGVHAAAILYDEYIVRVECGSSSSGQDKAN